jgi:hypothetical protein
MVHLIGNWANMWKEYNLSSKEEREKQFKVHVKAFKAFLS